MVSDSARYVVAADEGCVQVWAGYQIQFQGERRYPWQDELVRELKVALAAMRLAPGDPLSGIYASSGGALCDVENRLFTNPGAATFPAATMAIRWERGFDVPPAPRPMAALHYYRYCPDTGFRVWQRDRTLARWSAVPRRIADDGSARPMWLALRTALLNGAVDVLQPPVDTSTRFGLRIEVRAPARGPRSAPAVSEALVDGALCALHAGAAEKDATAVATALATKLPGVDPAALVELVTQRPVVLPGSPFRAVGSGVQLSPCDERCDAGEVSITRDFSLGVVETSGELFTLRRCETPS
jgi:hypothetical protein